MGETETHTSPFKDLSIKLRRKFLQLVSTVAPITRKW